MPAGPWEALPLRGTAGLRWASVDLDVAFRGLEPRALAGERARALDSLSSPSIGNSVACASTFHDPAFPAVRGLRHRHPPSFCASCNSLWSAGFMNSISESYWSSAACALISTTCSNSPFFFRRESATGAENVSNA